MKECEIEHTDVSVTGGVVNAFLDAFGVYRARGMRVLGRHLGLDTLSPESNALYPVDKLLQGMNELQSQFGRGFLTRIGQSIYERAMFPGNLDTFPIALAAADAAYYMNHANAEGKIGHYHWSPDGQGSGTMVCDNPYPCAFDQGIFAGMALQFGCDLTITHLEENVCRHTGASHCTYRLEWRGGAS